MNLLQYSIVSISTAILFTCNFFILQSTACSILLFSFFLLLTGWIIGNALFLEKKESFKLPIGTLLVLLLFPITLTPAYWFFDYHTWYPVVAALLILIFSGVLVRFRTIPIPTLPKFSLQKKELLLSLIPIGLFTLLVFVLIHKTHGDTIISPWIYIGNRFWLITLLALITSIFTTIRVKHLTFRYTVLALWYTIVLSVILFMYKYAFGFDQHIHLASMNFIIDFGSVAPKVPYYLGQYFLAIPLAELTGLSLDWVSRALVPIGASVLLPLLFIKKEMKSITHLFFLPLIPLSFFTFTTPNNLALLFALITILWTWKNWNIETKETHLIAGIFILFALITHVFIGLPLVCVYISLYVKKLRLLSYSGIIFVLPMLLTFFAGAVFGFTLEPILSIFREPHWFVGQTDSRFWHILYNYKSIVPYIFVLIALFGAYTNKASIFVKRLLGSIVSLLLLATLSSVFLTFPELLSYEQGVYAQRLFQLVLVTTIPLFLLGMQTILAHKRKHIILILIIPLLFASYYFTYPTRDPISLYTGVSIRDADVEAIRFIDEHAGDTPYIVLTNQSVSAAAMGEFGMSRYIQIPDGNYEYLYSIPTGGPLYAYFREYMYEGYNRESIEKAIAFAGVERAYIIHTNYWAPAGDIRDVSKELADNWWEFGEGRVWVFEFIK